MLTRFAPAPTGYLHLGHVANALYVWGAARARGAQVLLRVEDHDRQRCRPEYEEALLDDLDWLGLRPDVGATSEFRAGPSLYRQSDNYPAYEAAVEQLLGAGRHVYACDCSRRDLAGPGEAVPDREVPYRGRCRERNLARGPGRGLRLELGAGPERFDDLRLGPQEQDPDRQCGDLLIRDRLGNWTYQFAVVVDDMRHGVELVVRGEDLLPSTGRQIRLGRLLGRPAPPAFLHHPLIRKPGGEKLSKAAGDTGVRELRARGESPESLFGRALAGLGLLASPRPVSLPEALESIRAGHPRSC
jgi:glutamyl-tRNA synthetase/glutamyl-Q tRNA(Asp) synthetase